jgi:disulfide bond formation protein DsbB
MMRVFFSLLALAANAAVLGYVVLAVAARRSRAAAGLRAQLLDSLSGRELHMGFVVALAATLGSLYLSEIVHLIPCRLCWFQRIFMYPLVIVLGIAARRRDTEVVQTAGALAGMGLVVSIYHYLLQQFPSLDSGACDITAPCSAAYIWQWNFLSVPYMAGSAFALILTLLFALRANVARMPEYETVE